MKLLKMFTLIFLLTPALATVQAKTKKPYKLPATFNLATYVYVEAVDGQEFNPRLLPEDQQAISDVYAALYDWKRYIPVVNRDEADLIFVVRVGRVAQGDVGVLAGGGGPGVSSRPGNRPGSGTGVAAGGEVSSPDDLLEVYSSNPDHDHGTLLWQRTQADGLDHPDIPLFKQLKEQIEHDYPAQSASNSKKP
jgi:hypothetical protein